MKAGAVFLAVLAFLLPSGVHAQSCLGFPTGERRISVGARVESWDAGDSRSGYILWNPERAVAVGLEWASVSRDYASESTSVQTLWIALDFHRGQWAVCPFTDLSLVRSVVVGTRLTATGHEITFRTSSDAPLGVGIARTIRDRGEVILSLFAAPHLYYYKDWIDRHIFDLSGRLIDEVEEEWEDSGVGQAIDLGVSGRYLRFTLSAQVGFDSREALGTSYTLGIGILLH